MTKLGPLFALASLLSGCRTPAVDYEAALAAVHRECTPAASGATAQYISALRDADPDRFGVAIVTVDGAVYEVGDTRVPFAIMSVAKPFTALLVLEQSGADVLLEKVGAEPTGRPFNDLVTDRLERGLPINPMVNAGAIATVSLLAGDGVKDRWRALHGFSSRLAGAELTLMDDVLASVRSGGERNRLIIRGLVEHERIYCDPDVALEVYNRQSCLAIDVVQLARMGAVLANRGREPGAAAQLVAPDHADEVLSLMYTSGMYDSSGEWAYSVGLPAKSGVGGGIVAVAPGVCAIAAFSPRLDPTGNSVRAGAAIRSLAQRLHLGIFHPPSKSQ